jgi:hypothetical protein
MTKRKSHKRKILIPQVTETNLDNTFVRARQIDAATEYLCYREVNMGNPMVCLSNSVLAKYVLARIQMPELPKHLRPAEAPKQKKRLTKIIEALSWKNW